MDKNNTNVAKPITVAREEFITKMVETVNESQLPFFILESALKDLLTEIHNASIQQLEADKAKYEEQLKLAEKEASGK